VDFFLEKNKQACLFIKEVRVGIYTLSSSTYVCNVEYDQ
jgi:hypothetical protein